MVGTAGYFIHSDANAKAMINSNFVQGRIPMTARQITATKGLNVPPLMKVRITSGIGQINSDCYLGQLKDPNGHGLNCWAGDTSIESGGAEFIQLRLNEAGTSFDVRFASSTDAGFTSSATKANAEKVCTGHKGLENSSLLWENWNWIPLTATADPVVEGAKCYTSGPAASMALVSGKGVWPASLTPRTYNVTITGYGA
jgi:hypothetical protein